MENNTLKKIITLVLLFTFFNGVSLKVLGVTLPNKDIKSNSVFLSSSNSNSSSNSSPSSNSNSSKFDLPADLKEKLEKESKLDLINGEKLKDEEAINIIKMMLDTQKRIESYETEGTMIIYTSSERNEYSFTSTSLVKKGEYETIAEDGSLIYHLNDKQYIFMNGKWEVFPSLLQEFSFKNLEFNENSIDKLEVYKVEDGYVIQTKSELSAEDNYDLIIMKSNKISKPTKNNDTSLFQYKIDKEGKILEIKYINNYSVGISIFTTISITKNKNFNGGQTIEIPEDLKKIIEE